MKVVVLYRPNSEHGFIIDEFVRNFQARTSGAYKLEMINVDSREGAAMASLYDIMQYPAVLVIQNDGYMQQSWEGENLPLIDEVVAYSRA